MISRQDILIKATEDCIYEMYKWAQPSIDLKELIENGFEDDEKTPLWRKHYLSYDNYKFILDRYATAYGIVDEWDSTFELIYKQLEEGGIEDDYKPATEDRPGYRDYKKVDPLKMHLHIKDDFDVVIEYIKKIQNFFKGHCLETNKYMFTISLGNSPSSDKKEVEEYWKEHDRLDFKIKDFDIQDVIYGSDEFTSEEEFIKSLK